MRGWGCEPVRGVGVRQVIDRLGPLEWVLNTPSYHRVHHGRNRYCIGKNYGEQPPQQYRKPHPFRREGAWLAKITAHLLTSAHLL